MSNIDKRALRDSAESIIGILENIAGFEPSDIDGDAVELRFETEGGYDTGCDVSIVDQCQKAADVVRALLDDLESMGVQIANLTAERDTLREGEMGDAKHSNTRAAADIYFQLVEECEIPAGGSLVEYVSELRERAAMLQGADGNSPDGWVACSERMPNIGVPVITCCGDVVQYAAYAWDGKAWQDWYEEYDELPANTFTHWHSRPAAPMV